MNRLRAYLQLVRLPALFTALGDILLGYLLKRRGLEPISAVVLLMTASAGLYLAGMVFNDVFDREVDGRERPTRPIPSGRVSLRAAVWLGSVLMVVGVVAAGLAGTQTLLIAALLVGSVFAYDGLLKNTPLGPVMMGLCRLLNVLLGASFVSPQETLGLYLSTTRWYVPVFVQPVLPVACCMGLYIAGVTWFARGEAGTSRRSSLIGALCVVNLGLVGLTLYAGGKLPGLFWGGSLRNPGAVVLALGFVALILNRRMLKSLLDPKPAAVQQTVRTLLLSLIVLDATLIYYHTGSTPLAVGTAALLIPALVLGRWVYMT